MRFRLDADVRLGRPFRHLIGPSPSAQNAAVAKQLLSTHGRMSNGTQGHDLELTIGGGSAASRSARLRADYEDGQADEQAVKIKVSALL